MESSNMKRLLVDYHFHPNLPLSQRAAVKKCAAIWKAFTEQSVDVVVITEHVFKNPRRAFTLLRDNKPENATTIIFPGIEALTNEGVDVIVFSQTDDLYDDPKIMVPKQLSVHDMVRHIKASPTLYGSIPHPFGPGHSSIVNHIGVIDSIAAIEKLGAIEVHNACFKGSIKFADRTGLARIFPTIRKQAELVDPVPEKYYTDINITLFTGGSDAHIPQEIGSGMIVPVENSASADVVFTAIRTNTHIEFVSGSQRTYPWLSVYKTYNVIREAFTKAFRLYEGKVYQHDDDFTNFYSEAEKETILAVRKKRRVLLRPLLSFLTYFSVTPATLNALSVLSIVGSLTVVSYYPRIGFAWFCVYLSAAAITGALAEYQNRASEANAITKLGVQYTALLVPLLTAIWFEWADPFWSATYLGMYTIMLWLIITLNQIGLPIRLIIRSKFIVISALFLFLLTDINIITPTLIVFSVYMMGSNIYMFFRYRNAMRTPSRKRWIVNRPGAVRFVKHQQYNVYP